MSRTEIRTSLSPIETRDDTNGNHVISGYAIVFNQPSEDMGFIETIDKRALDGVDLSKVFCLYQHKWENVLARTDTKTLQLKVDDKGLAFTCQLPQISLGNDVYEQIRNGNIQGMSFGFTVAEDEWSADADGHDTRLIKKLDCLAEISLTAIPAYRETSVQAVREKHQLTKEKRNLLERIKLIERIEKIDS